MSQIKFIKKSMMISLETWEAQLNQEARKGWKVIQIFNSADGHLTALLRKDVL